MNNSTFIAGEFCFDINLETYLEEVVIKNEEKEIVVKIEAPKKFHSIHPENYQRAIYRVNEKGEASFIDTHQSYITATADGVALSMESTCKAIVEFMRYTATPEGGKLMMEKRLTAIQDIKDELRQAYNSLLNNTVTINCLKISDDGKFMIATEDLTEKGNRCPKHKSGIVSGIKGEGVQVPSIEALDFEKLETLLNKVLNLSPTPVNVGDIISLTPKQCSFYLKMLSVGEDILKETLEMNPLPVK